MITSTTPIPVYCTGCKQQIGIYTTHYHINSNIYCNNCNWILSNAKVAENKTIEQLQGRLEELQDRMNQIKNLAR